MRILMVSDVFFPRVNGVSTAIHTYRHQLTNNHIATQLIVPRYTDEADENGITRLPSYRVPMDPEDRFVTPATFRREAIRQAAQCDLVHIQTPFCAHSAGLAAARAHGIPAIATYHTLFEEYLHHYAKFIPRNWLRHLAQRVSHQQCNALDAVIVPSTAMQARLRDYGVTRPMHVLPTGIPLASFGSGDRARFRADYQIDPDRPVALYVGRAAHEKNIDFLIAAAERALRECPRLLLLIAGEGPAHDRLCALVRARRLEDSVRFLGYLERTKELPDCYAAADLFVFASRTETQGLVLLEAMAAGLPVVALAEMGTKDILVRESGAIVPPDDICAFATAIAKVVNDAGLRARIRAQGLAWANKWSDGALTTRLADLYRSLSPHGATTEISWKRAPSREKLA